MFKAYHTLTSVCAAKVRFALEEKGEPWTGRLVNLPAGENHTPKCIKLNPLGAEGKAG